MSKSAGRFLLIIVVSLFVLSVLPCVLSAADFEPISQEEMNLKDAPGHPGAPAMVLYHQEINDDNVHVWEVYLRIKIFTEAGREQANVTIPYNRRGGLGLRGVEGRTVHADGSIVRFDGKLFEKTIVKGRDRKYVVKAFTLPDVQVGSIIEYRYTFGYDDNKLYPPHWIIQNELPQKKVHFVFRPYQGEVVDRHDVVSSGVKWTFLVPKGTEPVQVNDQCPKLWSSAVKSCLKIVYDTDNVEPFIEEPYIPPSEMLKMNVRFYYDSRRKQDKFWSDEGKYWIKDIDKFLGNEAALRDELAKIIAPTDAPEQKVRKIYAHLGTYTNLTYSNKAQTLQDLQALGLAGKYGVDKVIKAKAGDREDLNRLFIGLVRQAGFPAYAMRVTARDDSFFTPQVLDWDQLDMEIAIVNLNGTDVFLDPGTRFCPFGMLYWKVSGSNGVRQSGTGKGTEFALTPLPQYKDAETRRSGKFSLDADGGLTGSLQIEYEGQEALLWRIRAAKTDAEGRKKLLEDEVKGWLPNTAEVTLSNQPLWEDTYQPLEATFKIASPIVSAAGRRRLLPMHMFDFNRPAMFREAARNFDIYLDYPYAEYDDFRVTLPPGVTPESIPQMEEVKAGFAYLRAKYSMEGSDLVSNAVVALSQNYLKVQRYPDVKGFFEKFKTINDEQIVLTGVPNAAAK